MRAVLWDAPEYVDYAIESDQGIRDLIVFGTRDDGLWFEGSINYQFTAVVPLAILARLLQNSGSELDLWTHRFANGRCLQDLLVGPLGTLFPDGTIPTIGDCYGYRLTLNAADLYYDAFDAYKRPDIGWLMSKRENLPASALFVENLPVAAEAPKAGTRLWPEHGYVMLRSQTGADYWKGEGFSAFLSYDRDTIHSQSDKLSMMVFGRGAHLAVDPEALATARHAFSSDVQKELNRSMICHNTIVVDQKGPSSATHPIDLLEFSQSADIALTTVGDLQGKLTPGVRLMRTVAATRDYVVDIFQAASEEPHTYEYLFHLPSSSGDFEPVDGFQPFEMPTENPWKWLKNARSKGVEDDWQVDAKQGDLTTRLNICAASGTRAIVCQFPHKDDFTGVPIPMVIARRTAKSAVFVSVLQAERGPFPELSVTVQPTRHGHLQVTVNRNNQKREFVVEAL